MCGRLIFVFIRVLFVYTDSSPELCTKLNLMQCYMEKRVVKKEEGATGQQFAELLCDFMFKRVFGSEANKDLLISFLNVLLEDAGD